MRKRLEFHWLGEKRTVKRFTIIPVILDYELRWLETVSIRQVWRDGRWHNHEFVEEVKDNENT